VRVSRENLAGKNDAILELCGGDVKNIGEHLPFGNGCGT
jgi:hypothetical protein